MHQKYQNIQTIAFITPTVINIATKRINNNKSCLPTASVCSQGCNKRIGKTRLRRAKCSVNRLARISGEAFGLAERNEKAAAFTLGCDAMQAILTTISQYHPGLVEILSISLRILVCVLRNESG